MIYFDTDVLVHYLLNQDPAKNQIATQLYQRASQNGKFYISPLCLQESAFVLSKLNIDRTSIRSILEELHFHIKFNFGESQFVRARELAYKIGFQNFSDCIHLAIAESYCDELYTFNKADFKKLQKYSELKITILP